MADLRFDHGGDIYALGKKRVLDFSANINPLGLPGRVKKLFLSNFQRILNYPDIRVKKLTKEIARMWGVGEENILTGNGSAELIHLIPNVYRPRTTLIPAPTFSEYERAARNVQSGIRYLRLHESDGFRLKARGMIKSDMSFFCNPNNPTGNLIFEDPEEIARSADTVVVDEAFMDFLKDQQRHTLIWESVKTKKLIVLRTLTKFFALPGLRIGYVIAHKDVISRLRKRLPPWNINSYAELAAGAMINDKSYIKKSYAWLEKETPFLYKELSSIKGILPYPTITNFIMFKILKKGLTSALLQKRLINKGILIRDCSNFVGLDNRYIRVAVRLRGENMALIRALREII